ncbi:MAG: class D sortase [Acidimicrobiales bacterium]
MSDSQATIATPVPDGDEDLSQSRPNGSGHRPFRPDDDSAPVSGASPAGPSADDITAEEPPGRTLRIPDIPLMRLAGLALIGVGALIVCFLIYLLAFTPLSASRNQQRLSLELLGQPLTVYGLVGGRVPSEGSAVAVLEVPALHLRQIVVEGTSAADLMNGPGLMPGTVLPGGPGNSVIAGRRVTFGAPFGSLGQLRAGDKVRVVDGAGSFSYRVTRTRVVTGGERDVIAPTLDNRLTLVTSNSTVAPNGRLVVVARLTGRPVAVTSSAVAVPSYELGLSGDPAAGGLTVMWALLTVIVVVVAGVAAWRWRRPVVVYLFAAPLVMACGLFACESLARALPATF